MRNKTEQRASSAGRCRRRKVSNKFSSMQKKDLTFPLIRQLNTEQYLDLLPKKKSESKTTQLIDPIDTNLPEFQNFQSDHILLPGLIASHPFYDRLRGSSAFSMSKLNRQTTNQNKINVLSSPTELEMVPSTISPRPSHSSSKRSSRSRQADDSKTNDLPLNQYQQQQQQQQTSIARPLSLRQMTNTFDSIACFHEVSRLVIFSSGSFFFKQTTFVARGREMSRTKTHTHRQADT